MKWHREPEAELTDLRTLTSQSPVKAEVLGNRNWVNKGDWMEERRKEQRGIGRWRGSVNWRERRECERDTEKKIIRAKIKQIRETKTQAHPSLELPPASTCSPVVPFCRGSCTWKKKNFQPKCFPPFSPWAKLSYSLLFEAKITPAKVCSLWEGGLCVQIPSCMKQSRWPTPSRYLLPHISRTANMASSETSTSWSICSPHTHHIEHAWT